MGLGASSSIFLTYLGYCTSTGPDNEKLLMAAALCIDKKEKGV